MSLIPSWEILEDQKRFGLDYLYKENFSDKVWSEWGADVEIEGWMEFWILVFNISFKWIDKLEEVWNNPYKIGQIKFSEAEARIHNSKVVQN